MVNELWHLSKQVRHTHRVEVFGGSLAYTLACEPEGYSEVVNDLNQQLSTFWMVLQHRGMFSRFKAMCEATPFSEIEWGKAKQLCDETEQTLIGLKLSEWGVSAVTQSHAFFVMVRQSLAARQQQFSPLSRNRVRRGMNEQASAWLSAIEGLDKVHGRLQRVAIRCKDFGRVIEQEDGYETLFYLDPPYLHSTRASIGEYKHEMTEAQHEQLLYQLSNIRGHFILSGYPSDMYDSWSERRKLTRIEVDLPNNAAGGEVKGRETEVLYANFKCSL